MRLTVAATIVCMMLAQHAIAQNNVVVINGGGRVERGRLRMPARAPSATAK